ncbi:hypothetical protein EDD91_7381 [Streptomyces sp. KS 21]|nr:hypothetical protein EDD91_7381 [Streptomyces sp. KS 21]
MHGGRELAALVPSTHTPSSSASWPAPGAHCRPSGPCSRPRTGTRYCAPSFQVVERHPAQGRPDRIGATRQTFPAAALAALHPGFADFAGPRLERPSRSWRRSPPGATSASRTAGPGPSGPPTWTRSPSTRARWSARSDRKCSSPTRPARRPGRLAGSRLRGGSECHRDSFAWWLRQGFPAYHYTAGQSRREFPARYSPRGTTSARRVLGSQRACGSTRFSGWFARRRVEALGAAARTSGVLPVRQEPEEMQNWFYQGWLTVTCVHVSVEALRQMIVTPNLPGGLYT